MTHQENTAPATKNRRKVVVIGLDGGTWDVLDPLMAEGRMPNLARLVAGGARSNLNSTIPPVTGPAWTSFMTGKDPGSHGLFDFVKPSADGYGREIVNFSHIRSRSIFRILSDAGLTVGVVGVPVTYPPLEVNGYLVSGMLTPSTEVTYTHPADLADEIKERFGDYVLDIWWQHYNPGQEEVLLDALLRCARQRWQVSLHFMKTRPTDFFMTVFVATDRIHHSLWHILCPEGEPDERTRRLRDKIFDVYEEIDRGIGELMQEAGEDANYLLMSDHGFGSFHGKFSINTWLNQLGLLSCSTFSRKSVRLRENAVGFIRAVLQKIDPKGRRHAIKKMLLPSKKSGRMQAYQFLELVDWSKTKAYSASNTESGIYINLKGRESQGIVEPGPEAEEIRKFIVEKLQEIRLPGTDTPFVRRTRIAPRERLYRGPFAERAPDIIFFPEDGWLLDVKFHPELFLPITWQTGSGTHRLPGFFAAHGPDIRAGLAIESETVTDIDPESDDPIEIPSPRIADLAPTILGMMGVPIPTDMNGRVLEEVLTEEFLAGGEFAYVEVDDVDPTGPAQDFSSEEAARVEEQLKDLGYL